MESPQNVVAVFLSDLHLSVRAWKSRPIEGDSAFALKQACDLCRKHNAPLVLAGDVFDTRQFGSWPLHVFLRHTADLPRVYFIQGQHEMQDPPWCGVASNAEHIHGKTVQLGGGINMYGIDFQLRGDLAEQIDKIPPSTDVVLAHQVWDPWMPEFASPQGSLKDVPHCSLMVSGDLHQYKSDQITRDDGSVYTALSLGAASMRTVAEPSHHFVGLMDSSGSVTPWTLDSRPVVDREYNTTTSLEEAYRDLEQAVASATASAPEEVKKPILRIKVDRQLNIESELKDRFGESSHLFIRMARESDNNEPSAFEGVVRHASASGMETALAMTEAYFQEQGEDNLVPMAKDLIQDPDTHKMLSSHHQKVKS